MSRPFTGRDMAFTIVAFFAVVIAVNMLMATIAARSFGGTVVDNSYVASQHFNGWLREAKKQYGLGWTVKVSRVGLYAVVVGRRAGVPLGGASIVAVAMHPLGVLPDLRLHFRETARGHYQSVEALPPGRWRLYVDVHLGAEVIRHVQDLGA